MSEGLDVGTMLSKIAENPEATAMLRGLLAGAVPSEESEGEHGEVPPVSSEAGGASSHRRAHPRRREMLLCLRPYLGARRCASLDRILRALEIYEALEQTNLLKGDRHV